MRRGGVTAPYRRGGELAVNMIRICARRVAVRDGENLVEVAVAVGLVAFAHHAASSVVGVARRHAVDDGEIRW